MSNLQWNWGLRNCKLDWSTSCLPLSFGFPDQILHKHLQDCSKNWPYSNCQTWRFSASASLWSWARKQLVSVRHTSVRMQPPCLGSHNRACDHWDTTLKSCKWNGQTRRSQLCFIEEPRFLLRGPRITKTSTRTKYFPPRDQNVKPQLWDHKARY